MAFSLRQTHVRAQMNSELIDSSWWMRRIASPRAAPPTATLDLPAAARLVASGMVSVTMTSSSGDSSMRSIAGPESTAWVAQAMHRAARRPP